MVTCGLRRIVSGSSTPSLMMALVLPHLDTEEDAFEADGGSQGDHAPTHTSSRSYGRSLSCIDVLSMPNKPDYVRISTKPHH